MGYIIYGCTQQDALYMGIPNSMDFEQLDFWPTLGNFSQVQKHLVIFLHKNEKLFVCIY
jgi:hypothetical protein